MSAEALKVWGCAAAAVILSHVVITRVWRKLASSRFTPAVHRYGPNPRVITETAPKEEERIFRLLPFSILGVPMSVLWLVAYGMAARMPGSFANHVVQAALPCAGILPVLLAWTTASSFARAHQPDLFVRSSRARWIFYQWALRRSGLIYAAPFVLVLSAGCLWAWADLRYGVLAPEWATASVLVLVVSVWGCIGLAFAWSTAQHRRHNRRAHENLFGEEARPASNPNVVQGLETRLDQLGATHRQIRVVLEEFSAWERDLGGTLADFAPQLESSLRAHAGDSPTPAQRRLAEGVADALALLERVALLGMLGGTEFLVLRQVLASLDSDREAVTTAADDYCSLVHWMRSEFSEVSESERARLSLGPLSTTAFPPLLKLMNFEELVVRRERTRPAPAIGPSELLRVLVPGGGSLRVVVAPDTPAGFARTLEEAWTAPERPVSVVEQGAGTSRSGGAHLFLVDVHEAPSLLALDAAGEVLRPDGLVVVAVGLEAALRGHHVIAVQLLTSLGYRIRFLGLLPRGYPAVLGSSRGVLVAFERERP